MPTTFATYRPHEASKLREVRLALEVLDPVTCERIREGLVVRARGMDGAPILNAGGLYVWIARPGNEPTEVEIEPGGLPFDAQTIPVPALPTRFVSTSLSPTTAYRMPQGVPGVVGRLVERRMDRPLRPVVGARVWLQWINAANGGSVDTDAPIRGTTDANGDFSAFARLLSNHEPAVDAKGRWRVRVVALLRGASTPRRSTEFSIRPGHVAVESTAFAWSEFVS